MTILLVVIGLSVLILGHEWGHFFAAKKFGLKVDEFGFGFPPRIFAWRPKLKKRKNIISSTRFARPATRSLVLADLPLEKGERADHAKSAAGVSENNVFSSAVENSGGGFGEDAEKNETEYSLNWLPFGGFVKIAGENDRIGGDMEKLHNLPEVEKKRIFLFQPAWKRAVIILAGIAVNFVIGWILVSAVFMVGTPRAVVITDVAKGSPAEQVGILPGDVIRDYVESKPFINLIDENRGREIELTILRGKEEMKFAVTPRVEKVQGQGALGVVLVEAGFERQGFFGAIGNGFIRTGEIAYYTFVSFYKSLANLATKGALLEGVVGPIGIFGIAEQAGQLGLIYLVQLISLISINLAVINLIPFPALDGGRFFLILVEKIKGSPIPLKVEAILNGVGFALLILLMVVITVRDVTGWF